MNILLLDKQYFTSRAVFTTGYSVITYAAKII